MKPADVLFLMGIACLIAALVVATSCKVYEGECRCTDRNYAGHGVTVHFLEEGDAGR